MAILQVNQPQQQKQEKPVQEESALDKVTKALGIASSMLGIAKGVGAFKSTAQEQQEQLIGQKLEQGTADAEIEEQIAKGNLDSNAVRRKLEAEGNVVSDKPTFGEFSRQVAPNQPLPGREGPSGDPSEGAFITSPGGLSAFKAKQAQRLASQPKVNPRAISIPDDLRAQYLKQGLTNEQIDFVEAGGGGRNALGTLNKLVEQDEPKPKDIQTITAFRDSEDRLEEALASVEESFTGPVDGRIPDFFTKDEEVAFRAKLGRFGDAYRTAVTGAGASVEEVDRLMKNLPTKTDTFANFKAKARGLLKDIRKREGTYLDTLEQGGLNISEFREAALERLKMASQHPNFSDFTEDKRVDPQRAVRGPEQVEEEKKEALALLRQRRGSTPAQR